MRKVPVRLTVNVAAAEAGARPRREALPVVQMYRGCQELRVYSRETQNLPGT